MDIDLEWCSVIQSPNIWMTLMACLDGRIWAHGFGFGWLKGQGFGLEKSAKDFKP